ncbi:MAG: alpha/beta hydrolase [Thermoanaerobaculia bacterium]
MSLARISSAHVPRPIRYLVVEPPSYQRTPDRRYPVLYFFHDGYGTERTLAGRGIAEELRARMADGRLPEFFVVAPGGRGTWFSDSHDGKVRYERFIVEDLLREIGSRYRVIADRGGRGATGISMGGFGAVKLGLKHPELFGAVSSLSGPLIPIGWEDLALYGNRTRRLLTRVFGDSREDNSLAANDVWQIAKELRSDQPPAVQLRGGTEDGYGLGRVATQFGSYLSERGVPTTVVLEPGEHRWSYWRDALLAVCAWHAKRFTYDRSGSER